MKVVLLIGGIASGKSSVSKLFEDRGARCIDLDQIGHGVLRLPEVANELVAEFGPVVLDGGCVSRPALAKAAFCDAGSLLKLNRITHPRIVDQARQQIATLKATGCPLAIVEVSAYDGPSGSLGSLANGCDAVVAVVAPEPERISRAVAKGFSEVDARQRIARQPSDDQRIRWSDFIISNDGDFEELESQVEGVFNSIVGGAQAGRRR